MLSLAAATALFLAIHVFVSGTPLRDRLVGRIGNGPYQGLFSLASLGALVWMILAWRAAPVAPLYDLGAAGRWIALPLTLAAFLLAVPGLLSRNPTTAGQDGLIANERPARGLVTVTRHPFLWGTALWAIGHLAIRGDLASLLFFGGLAALALFGPFLIDAKLRRRDREHWERFAAVTSWLPFLAVVQGRTRPDWAGIGLWKPVLGLAVWIILVAGGHAWLFGVPALG